MAYSLTGFAMNVMQSVAGKEHQIADFSGVAATIIQANNQGHHGGISQKLGTFRDSCFYANPFSGKVKSITFTGTVAW